MKFNFKKVSAIASSVLLAGMTLGVAAAANYPSPFVDGGANVAVVYGANAAGSDVAQATNIQLDLQDSVTGSVTEVSGGESFALEKSSDLFNFNENLASIYDDLGEDEMDFLNDGTYDDGDIDEDYSQTLNLNSGGLLTLFAEDDYKDEEPTIGIHYEKGDEILNYVMEFDSTISMADMEDTDVPLFGKEYYVLDAENGTSGSKLTLLDTAERTTVEVGEVKSVGGKDVSLEFVDSDSAILIVDGEMTDSLSANEEFELADESYVVITDILYHDYSGGTQKVEFSLGSGKMILEDTKEIEVNDEKVDELYADFAITNDDLTSITITWKADDDLFLTQENSLTMPLFETVSLVMEDMDFPSDSEEIVFSSGNSLVLEMDNFEIELLNSDTADAIYSGEKDHALVTKTEDLSANYSNGYDNVTALIGGLNLKVDDRFIVTILDEDLSDIDQAYYEVSEIDYDSASDIDVSLVDLIGDNDMDFDEVEDLDVPGLDSLNINITGINDTSVYLNFTGDAAITFNKVVSDKGLLITLPEADRDDTVTLSSTLLTVEEADDEGDIGEGAVDVSVGVSNSSNDKLYATCSDSDVTEVEETTDKKYIGYFESALATKVTRDEDPDEDELELEYYGEEVSGTVNVVAEGAISTSAGVMVVKDSEVSSVSSKNLIVVGGSCINSVAANILGGSLCGAAFTSETDVGTGQFLIESVESPYDASKVALLVAGYEAADTVAASTYLRTQDVDTDEGNKYIGTSSTEATLVVD